MWILWLYEVMLSKNWYKQFYEAWYPVLITIPIVRQSFNEIEIFNLYCILSNAFYEVWHPVLINPIVRRFFHREIHLQICHQMHFHRMMNKIHSWIFLAKEISNLFKIIIIIANIIQNVCQYNLQPCYSGTQVLLATCQS